MNKRISFSESDAEMIYEWRLAFNQGLKKRCCEDCELIEKRIKRFLGKDALLIEKLVKIYPYFKNKK